MIEILMASYNGEKYIAEQIESILHQSYTDWRLIIQDDCSSDNTPEIIDGYARQYPQKITVFHNRANSGSAKNNFCSLIERAASDYIMFSDQDDFWLPDKLAVTHKRMRAAEIKYGKECPILVHTDLSMTDKDLNITAKSMFEHEGWNIAHKKQTFLSSLLGNTVTGCTVEVNRSLLRGIDTKTMARSPMHDWWLGMYAREFGHLIVVDTPTILYRQHGANSVGISNTSKIHQLWEVFSDRKAFSDIRHRMQEVTDVCRLFYKEYAPQMKKSDRKALRSLVKTDKKRKAELTRIMIRNRIGAPYFRALINYLIWS